MKSKKSKVATAVVVSLFSVSTVIAATATKTAVNPNQSNGNWWLTDANWNPAGKPTASDTCLIPSASSQAVNKFGADSEDAATFTGDSLQVGTVGGNLVVLVDQSSPNRNLKFPGKGLIFGRTSYRAWDNTVDAKIDGNLTILSPESAPSNFSANKNSTTYELLGKLIGEEESCLDLNAENDTATLTFPLTFDATEFLGKLRYNPKAKTMLSTFGNVTFNGTIEAARTKFTVPIDVVPTVAKMHVSGAEVELSVGVENAITGDRRSGHLTVTKGFTLAEGAKIRYTQTVYPDGWKSGADGLTLWPFLTVPIESPLTVDSFDLTKRQTMKSGVFYPEYDLVVRADESADTKTFVSRRRPYVQIEAENPTLSPDGTRFAWGGCDPDTDYFTKGAVGRNHYTPNQAAAVFGGKSLCLWSELDSTKTVMQTHSLIVQTGDVTFDDLRVQAGDRFQAYKAVSETVDCVVLRGNMFLFKDSRYPREGARVNFRMGGNSVSIEVAANISGTEDVVTEGFSNSAGRSLILSGDNSAWTGGILATNNATATSRIVVSRTEALGGPLPAFRADALTIGENGIFGVTDDVTMSEPTRGVTVAAATATVEVPAGKTLAVSETVTYATGAKLTKKGAGTLALGGTPVVSGQAQLLVSEGRVQPLSSAAFAGVTLDCGADGAVVYKADGTTPALVDPALAQGGVFRMTVDLTEVPGRTISLPVCELNAADVAAFKSAFKFLKPISGVRCVLHEEPLGNGRVRILAEVGRFGFFLVVK